ncbi:MAG TPA: DUF6508 domain-containing protein, partial [Anaerolineales bacterium]|nr:DUF6508 domain-containing protein [Anaerolineales bacterium]
AARECWLDYGYSPEQASQMLRDETLIKSASLPQIKTMLTFCVRGERFSDGHWGSMIREGYIRRLLERLIEIKSEQVRYVPASRRQKSVLCITSHPIPKVLIL